MPRVPRHIAAELIQFVKKVELKASFWDPMSTSAFEFARQMSSPKLKKINPTLEVNLVRLENIEPPQLHVEYLDGSSWATGTAGLHASDLRYILYEKAADAEDKVGDSGGGGDGGAGKDAGSKGGKGAAAKGGKK